MKIRRRKKRRKIKGTRKRINDLTLNNITRYIDGIMINKYDNIVLN